MRFAVVLSFLTSSARLTVSVSFRSLSCNLCSINCRFFACSPVPMNHSKTAHARSKDREHSQHQQGAGKHSKKRRTASLAFRSLSSFLALFSVPSTSPNIVLPRFRSRGSTAMSMRGRFFVVASPPAPAPKPPAFPPDSEAGAGGEGSCAVGSGVACIVLRCMLIHLWVEKCIGFAGNSGGTDNS